jgi:dihydroxy-acid dehydratase
MGGQWYDANISIPGCDKNMPGVLMAMGRFNRPSLMVYGGTIKPGQGCGGEKLDIVSAFQAYGEYVAGSIDENKRFDIIRHACPGPGACGGSKCKDEIRDIREIYICIHSVHCQHHGFCS